MLHRVRIRHAAVPLAGSAEGVAGHQCHVLLLQQPGAELLAGHPGGLDAGEGVERAPRLKAGQTYIIEGTHHKTAAQNAEDFWKDLHTSLTNLRTDYIDLYQFHNPAFCPKPGDGSGLYEAMQEAKAKGMIQHIGITNHRLAVAHEAIDSGLYETLQFPFSYISGEQELELVI